MSEVDPVTRTCQVLDSLGAAPVEGRALTFRLSHVGDADIVVVVTARTVEFRLPTLVWTSPYEATPTTRLWRREPIANLTPERLAELVSAAKQARLDEFQPCRFCGRKFPPEHRDDDVCHGCEETELGIVH